MVFLGAVVICYIPAGFKCLKLNNKMSYHSFAHMCVCVYAKENDFRCVHENVFYKV